ncbi:MAG: hypothetical protein Unbinned5930contig1000_42 [Prokaryotic dsDNA virus sp.]|nr:MAG: hypothetical protein Unbinned5930contig1000_42 [Prokaryotic dsDNA virus sp.]|tara:strand:+ start:1117 stop:1533 length:417 start_codon:yes stop_codon:yes gene_type:complete
MKGIPKGNYDWSRPTKPVVENNATARQRRYGLLPTPKSEEIKQAKETMDKTMRKVKSVYEKMTDEDKLKVKEIILETEIDGISRNEKLTKRRTTLYPFYKKYVDPSSKLSGCRSCIQAQSKFFEMLVRYMKEYEQESQ